MSAEDHPTKMTWWCVTHDQPEVLLGRCWMGEFQAGKCKILRWSPYLAKRGRVKFRRLWWLPGKFIAITLPPFGVWIRDGAQDRKDLSRIIRHEGIHWDQYLRWGWMVYIRYVGLWIRHGYWNHPHEVEARERST